MVDEQEYKFLQNTANMGFPASAAQHRLFVTEGQLVLDEHCTDHQPRILARPALARIHLTVIPYCQAIPRDNLTPFHLSVLGIQLSPEGKAETFQA
jgi:hypothetical protein